jgi:hypothetical protein
MPQNRKKQPVGDWSPRKPRDKTMLLPHSAAHVREQSLHWHLALAAFRIGKGNGDLLAELVKALYLAWYLQQAGFGAVDHQLYLDAERILDAAARNAGRNIWLIESADCLTITSLLDLHEPQLSGAPVYAVVEAQHRVVRFGKSYRRSPW